MHRLIRPSAVAGGASSYFLYSYTSNNGNSDNMHSSRIDPFANLGRHRRLAPNSWLSNCDSNSALPMEAKTRTNSSKSRSTTLAALTPRTTIHNHKTNNGHEKLILISGSAHPELSKEISEHLQINLADASVSRFADGAYQFHKNE